MNKKGQSISRVVEQSEETISFSSPTMIATGEGGFSCITLVSKALLHISDINIFVQFHKDISEASPLQSNQNGQGDFHSKGLVW